MAVETVFEDDFESGNLNKWTSVASWAATTAQKYSGGWSAYGYGALIKDLSALIKARLTFYIRIDATNQRNYIVHWPYWALVAQDDGHWQYYDGAYHNLPTDTTFIANTWYKIVVEFDADANSIKYWINDAYKGEVTTISFDSITKILCTPHSASKAYIDVVKMEDLAAPPPVGGSPMLFGGGVTIG